MNFTLVLAAIVLLSFLIVVAMAVKTYRRAMRARDEFERRSHDADANDAGDIDERGANYRKHLRSLRAEHEAIDAKAVLGYDPADASLHSLVAFAPLKAKSACIFAKRSLAWGAPAWDEAQTIEQNCVRIAPGIGDSFARAQYSLTCSRDQRSSCS